MIRRSLAIAAALSLGTASLAQAAAPVRPGAAPVAAKPLSSRILPGDRVGAEAPEDANALLGSTLATVVIIILLLGGGAAIIIGSSGASSPT